MSKAVNFLLPTLTLRSLFAAGVGLSQFWSVWLGTADWLVECFSINCFDLLLPKGLLTVWYAWFWHVSTLLTIVWAA